MRCGATMADRRIDRSSPSLTPPDPRERWARVSALLDAALELPPGEQATFVRSIEDPALHDEVARLLAACARAENDEGLATGGAAALSPGEAHGMTSDAPDALLNSVREAVAGRYAI